MAVRRAGGKVCRNSSTAGTLAIPGAEAAPWAVSSLMTGPLVMTIGKKKMTRNSPLNLNLRFKNMAITIAKINTIRDGYQRFDCVADQQFVSSRSVNKARE